MPEGDTVFHAARELREALAGRALTRSDFRVPRFAVANLSGRTVTEVVPRGKHLLIRTDNGLTVHTHLKMEGRWRIAPASERLRESYRIRLILANDQWRATGYELGIVELLPHRPGGTDHRAPRPGSARPGLGSGGGGPAAVRRP